MNTDCNSKRYDFQPLGKLQVQGRFDGGRITSDGGAVLLREVESRFGVIARLARCFVDYRDPERVEHSLVALLAQRVVGKAEYLAKGPNPRFVVTSLDPEKYPAQKLYEEVYCARGEMENRLKEQQLYLFADRTSAATMRANQLRLWFSTFAYVLLHLLRRFGLRGTEYAHAQCHTIRLKLLKLGAQVRCSTRRLVLAWASSYPYQELFATVYANLCQLVPLRC